jgi:hypothetical protein
MFGTWKNRLFLSLGDASVCARGAARRMGTDGAARFGYFCHRVYGDRAIDLCRIRMAVLPAYRKAHYRAPEEADQAKITGPCCCNLIAAYIPFLKKRVQVVGFALSEDADSIVFLPALPETSTLAGVHIMDKAVSTSRPATRADSRISVSTDR